MKSRLLWLAVLAAALVGASVGPARISPGRTFLEVLDHLPFVHVDSGPRQPRRIDE